MVGVTFSHLLRAARRVLRLEADEELSDADALPVIQEALRVVGWSGSARINSRNAEGRRFLLNRLDAYLMEEPVTPRGRKRSASEAGVGVQRSLIPAFQAAASSDSGAVAPVGSPRVPRSPATPRQIAYSGQSRAAVAAAAASGGDGGAVDMAHVQPGPEVSAAGPAAAVGMAAAAAVGAGDAPRVAVVNGVPGVKYLNDRLSCARGAPEPKVFSTSSRAQAGVTAAATGTLNTMGSTSNAQCILYPIQGTGGDNRIGRKISCRKLMLDYVMILASTFVDCLRVAIVLDTQANKTTALPAFHATNPSPYTTLYVSDGASPYGCLVQRHPDFLDRFKVLYESSFDGSGGGLQRSASVELPLDFESVFSDSTTLSEGADGGTSVRNALWIMFMGATTAKYSYRTQVTFTDA